MDRGAWWTIVLGVAESDMTEWLTLNLKALKRIPGKYKSSEAVACLGLLENNTEANRQHKYSEWEGQRIKWVSDNVRLVDHPGDGLPRDGLPRDGFHGMVFPGMVFSVMIFPVMVFPGMVFPGMVFLGMVFLAMVFPGMVFLVVVFPGMVFTG